MYFRGTFIKKCCVKFVYFQMGSESKENRLSCHFVHPSSVYEKFQLQLYTAELRLRTACRLLCDFLNHKYEATCKYLRRSWYCLIQIFSFLLHSLSFCRTVLSTSSIRKQHPLRTLMQITYTYAHAQGTKASQRP